MEKIRKSKKNVIVTLLFLGTIYNLTNAPVMKIETKIQDCSLPKELERTVNETSTPPRTPKLEEINSHPKDDHPTAVKKTSTPKTKAQENSIPKRLQKTVNETTTTISSIKLQSATVMKTKNAVKLEEKTIRPKDEHTNAPVMKIATPVTTKLKETSSSQKELSTSDASTGISITIDWPKLLIKGCDSSSSELKLAIRNETMSNLMHDLDCDSSGTVSAKKTVNFFSSATQEKYEDLLPLYAFAALSSNDNAVVEIVVNNATTFINRKFDILSWLSKFSAHRSGMICVRNYDHSEPIQAQRKKAVDNTFRFLEVPHVVANYTYIGDVDLFITESVLDPKRFEQMKYFKIPYSNVIRPNSTRLTGLMLVDTAKFYTPSLIEAQQKLDSSGNDEQFLYRLVEEAGHGLPIDTSGTPKGIFYSKYRPGHGVHLSFNRGPGKPMCQLMNTDIIEKFMLQTLKYFGEYLCYDRPVYDILSGVLRDINYQILGNMTVREGICQS